MNILEAAIKAEGGVGKLAEALGERQTTVSNWKSKRGIPKAWEIVLTMKYGQHVEGQSSEPNKEAA